VLLPSKFFQIGSSEPKKPTKMKETLVNVS
jgi:hypothetical protein